MRNGSMKLGVISPYVLTRKALCALMATFKEFQVAFDVDSALESFDLIQKVRPEILLLDSASLASDFEAVSRIQKLIPDTKFILLTEELDEDFQLRAIKAGVQGCVSKRADPQILLKALKAVSQGEIWASHRMATRIIGEFMRWRQPEEAESKELTRREWEILGLVANGFRNKEISSRLCISDNTVKTHLYAIYKKLQVGNRLGAALYYFHQAKQAGDKILSAPPPGRATARSLGSVKADAS